MTYDQWKTMTPPDFEHPENECLYCGEPTERLYCSNNCKLAEINELNNKNGNRRKV